MARGSNHEYLRTIRGAYHRANRQGKTALLTQAVQITGYHRKHVLRHLRASPTPSQRPRRARRRQASPEVIDALRLAWNAADRICAKRLQPFLPDMVTALERHGAMRLSPTGHYRCAHHCETGQQLGEGVPDCSVDRPRASRGENVDLGLLDLRCVPEVHP